MTKKTQATDENLSNLELPVDQALGVWFDLERALEGKNGYGGDVAEIYAYRLVPPRLSGCTEEERARVAGRNLTRLLHHFVDLHESAEIGIEDGARKFRAIDPRAEDFPPFSHRVHLRVLRGKLIRKKLAADLDALLRCARDLVAHLPQPDFGTWDSATRFLLLALGMEDVGEAHAIHGHTPISSAVDVRSMKQPNAITAADLIAAGWRSTPRAEWTNDVLCPPGHGSGLCLSFGEAQLWEAYVQARLRQQHGRSR